MEYCSQAPEDQDTLPLPSKRLFHRLVSAAQRKEQPLSIFRTEKINFVCNPDDRLVGGMSIARKIRQSLIKSSPSQYLPKTMLSTKMDTLTKQDTIMKTRTQFGSVQLKQPFKEETLKRDVIGLSVDKIKSITLRVGSRGEKTTLYQKNSRPFLQTMGQRSMSQYNEELIKKFGNRYFEKTLRSNYQDDPPKTYMVTVFGKQEAGSKIRRRTVKAPFFKRHQFMQIRGQSKKQKQTQASCTHL